MAPEPEPLEEPVDEVEIRRIIDAPRELVWKAWTEPARFAAWFCTPPFVTPEASVAMDVRPGGEWRATQVSEADDTRLPFAGVYREVVPPERLVFTFQNVEDPSDSRVEVATVMLYELSGATEMVFSQRGYLPVEQYSRLEEGYARFFDQLTEHLDASRVGGRSKATAQSPRAS